MSNLAAERCGYKRGGQPPFRSLIQKFPLPCPETPGFASTIPAFPFIGNFTNPLQRSLFFAVSGQPTKDRIRKFPVISLINGELPG
jgi:hypothetical protein